MCLSSCGHAVYVLHWFGLVSLGIAKVDFPAGPYAVSKKPILQEGTAIPEAEPLKAGKLGIKPRPASSQFG